MIASSDPSEIESWTNHYFAHSAHESLIAFLRFIQACITPPNIPNTKQLSEGSSANLTVEQSPSLPTEPYLPIEIWGDDTGFKAIIMMHSSIHINITSLVNPVFPSQVTQVCTTFDF
jgi:hypothetical protein